ncbi:MAG: hypothetical protein AMS18_00360 [Gemmatimonas sp. SG8_17]|nr:MAG: hypothetical protein AMS18_00360 [Gemmatimonas sp. SG8_17]
MSIYGILDREAKAWWYHAQLRRQGNVVEARKRERQSIRRDVEQFRSALECGGLLQIGKGGHVFYYHPHAHVSGYENADGHTAQCCRILGIPVLDVRPVVDRNPGFVWRAPLFRPGVRARSTCEVPDWMIPGLGGAFKDYALAQQAGVGCLDEVTRDEYIAMYVAEGAILS